MDFEDKTLTLLCNSFHSVAPIVLKFFVARDVYLGTMKLLSPDRVE